MVPIGRSGRVSVRGRRAVPFRRKEANMKVIWISSLAVVLLCGIGAYGRTDSETATRIVTAAYEDILGRKPDAAGLSDFRSKMVDQNWSEERVRKALKESPEYQKNRVDRIITAAYEDILGRKPDAAGLKEYRVKVGDEGWSEEQVRKALKDSPEYQKVRVDRIIDTAYQDLLGRKPDPAGRKMFTEKITQEGWGEDKVRAALKDSTEYKARRR
jgi:hypothetical protein